MESTVFDLPATDSNLINLHCKDDPFVIARKILEKIMNFRRISKFNESCDSVNCVKCTQPHLFKIISAIEKNKPVAFVLPAFPGKSPNLSKVLGHLPDYAEELALRFLGNLCQEVKKYYSPGMKIILCSDGRVFSDVIGMQEDHVTAYQTELDKMISKMKLFDMTTFNLDYFCSSDNFSKGRDELMKQYGDTLENLKNKIRSGTKENASIEEITANHMFRGITRFLFEDANYPGQIKSRTHIQKESRLNAYEVIRRSNAWSALIAEHFPDAVRLSIHPQLCGSEKLGIRLIGNEIWMTPWHSVAVETQSRPILLKRSDAEKLGAKLIYDVNERPSHYKFIEEISHDISNSSS